MAATMLEGKHPPPPIDRNLGLVLPCEYTIAWLPGFPGIPEASGRAVFKASPGTTCNGIPQAACLAGRWAGHDSLCSETWSLGPGPGNVHCCRALRGSWGECFVDIKALRPTVGIHEITTGDGSVVFYLVSFESHLVKNLSFISHQVFCWNYSSPLM